MKEITTLGLGTAASFGFSSHSSAVARQFTVCTLFQFLGHVGEFSKGEIKHLNTLPRKLCFMVDHLALTEEKKVICSTFAE